MLQQEIYQDKMSKVPSLFELCQRKVRFVDIKPGEWPENIIKNVAESRYQALCKITNIFNQKKKKRAFVHILVIHGLFFMRHTFHFVATFGPPQPN
jgi:hypothetical protein